MNAHTAKQIKLRILLPSILIFLIGLLLVTIRSYYTQNKHLEQNVSASIASVERLYKANIEYDIQKMEGALLYIKDNKEIQKAWKNQDRELLYSLCRKNFISLQENLRITHLYFIDLNQKVFLRVHNPQKYGDSLTRETISEALLTEKRSVGVEFGIHHNLTLRNVHPWFIDDKLCGFVEMGEEIDHILPHVAKMLGTDVFVTFNKKLFSREKWEKGINLYGHDTQWDILEDSVLIGKTMDHIPIGIDKYLNRQDETDNVLFKFKEQNKKYIGGYINLEDVTNKKVGKLVVIEDVTIRRRSVITSILLVLIAGIVLFIFVMVISVKYVNMISKKLDYYHSKLEDAAYIDALTGIGNRRYLNEKADMFFATNQLGVIIMIDLDNFKQVNDRYGHDVGDAVLKSMCLKISDYVRQDDIFARFGGEEFIILLPKCAMDTALIKAEAIRHAVESIQTDTKSGKIHVSISLGVYEIQDGDSFAKTIKHVDIALYLAKQNGKNCIEVFSTPTVALPEKTIATSSS